MKLTVRLFARARDLAGSDAVEVELAEGDTIDQVRLALATQHPSLQSISQSLLVAVGTEYADGDQPVSPDMQITCFPPVSGG